MLEEAIEDPVEVWISFERHRGTGEVVLRHRVIKAFDLGGRQKLFVVAQAVKGQLGPARAS